MAFFSLYMHLLQEKIMDNIASISNSNEEMVKGQAHDVFLWIFQVRMFCFDFLKCRNCEKMAVSTNE